MPEQQTASDMIRESMQQEQEEETNEQEQMQEQREPQEQGLREEGLREEWRQEEVDQQTEEAEPTPDPLAKKLEELGLKSNDPDADLQRIIQENRALRQQMQQQRFEPQKQTQQPTEEPKQEEPVGLPRWRTEFNDYLDPGTRKLDPSTPPDIVRDFKRYQDFELKRISQPEEWASEIVRQALKDESIGELLNPYIEKNVTTHTQQMQEQQELQKLEQEIGDSLFDKREDGSFYQDTQGNPILNEVGNRAVQEATNEFSRYGLDPNDPSNALRFMQAIRHYRDMFGPPQPAEQPEPEKTPEQIKQEKQQAVQKTNQLQTHMQDAGNDRTGDVPRRASSNERRVENGFLPKARQFFQEAYSDVENGRV